MILSSQAEANNNHRQTATDWQLAEAKQLQTNYLKRATFIEELPDSISGKAQGLTKQFSSHFSTSGTSEVTGTIAIDSIQGLMRVPIVSTDNLLHQNRKIKVQGKASVQQGKLIIYSPVEMDFWQMAALFVANPVKNRPPEADQVTLKGFITTVIKSGKSVNFNAELLPFANRYLLLLDSGDEVTSTVKLEFNWGYG